MSEKDKMLKGELYNGEDDELAKLKYACKNLCFTYNRLLPSALKERTALLKEILGKLKGHCTIEQPFMCDYGFNIAIGDNFYANHNLIILDAAKVKIGDNVFIGPNCGIYTSGHPLDYKTRNASLEYAKEVNIGNNVWIGGNVVICPGVTIGDNVVIGAGSVVTKDLPANTLAYGSPCKAIRNLEK